MAVCDEIDGCLFWSLQIHYISKLAANESIKLDTLAFLCTTLARLNAQAYPRTSRPVQSFL
ncbi:hypothetical protein PAXRUDRAFT_828601 [Paxillus rubicundulus Ve08.2h10]|uniref:Uncharacterized protein n=1 Tax=Paxillus rubicundulus Ve08.2h10 TaxID=930991 RepID=A0A0D0D9R5_9AGAM|nr:hypothetical protein PAXRUDRAFT_828601 [Paxillus rubicundulus Ve08.2h10]